MFLNEARRLLQEEDGNRFEVLIIGLATPEEDRASLHFIREIMESDDFSTPAVVVYANDCGPQILAECRDLKTAPIIYQGEPNLMEKVEEACWSAIRSRKTPVKVLVHYAPEDGEWAPRLQPQLESLPQVEICDYNSLRPGVHRQQERQRLLHEADVAVLLVGPHFLASGECTQFVRDWLRKDHPLLSKPLFWIAVSTCLYNQHLIGKYQCFNNPQKPLDQLSDPDCEVQFVKLCKQILQIRREFNKPD